MKVLIVGSGGREHALGWRLARSPRVQHIVSCPGNGGLSRLGDVWSLPIDQDFHPLLEKIRAQHVDFVVVGPEAPLVGGLADFLRQHGVPTFGPSAQAARLEGSKVFAKKFLARHSIPTAEFRVVNQLSDLEPALDAFPDGVVVKADGLAAGKGVTVAANRAEARSSAVSMLSGAGFGAAGRQIVLEQQLHGVEITLLVLLSDEGYRVLEPAHDYKRLQDGDAGPNTGGMGAYSPSDLVSEVVRRQVDERVLLPTIEALRADGISYQGILYLGLMLTPDGPQVLEYNVRLGDPETQPLLMRMRTDPVDVFEAVAQGRVSRLNLEWDPRSAVCVVMASEGYPHSGGRPVPIEGPAVSALDDVVQVFHAGTRWTGEGFETNGGRVLGVTALADTKAEARRLAYDRVRRIHFEGCQYRLDIAASTADS